RPRQGRRTAARRADDLPRAGRRPRRGGDGRGGRPVLTAAPLASGGGCGRVAMSHRRAPPAPPAARQPGDVPLMFRSRFCVCVVCAIAAAAASALLLSVPAARAADAPKPVSFIADVAPILK